MSMQTLTIIQFISTFAIYYGLTVLLPALVFHRRLKGERFAVRFLAYLTMGNFYLMNLVFVLQLLHISNRYTLILFTAVPAAWAAVRQNDVMVTEHTIIALQNVTRFFEGTLGFRLAVSNLFRLMGRGLKKVLLKFLRSFWKHFFDWVGSALVVLTVLWIYGRNLLENYGYCASDIPVHNYWINALGNNNIFVAGVYPHGFHCVIYYIHSVFGIETFVLLRVFCLVQNLTIHLVLLAFLKACCRTKYAPYVALALYVLANIWNLDVTARFGSSLPQEFGMIFILPSIWFLIQFFEERKNDKNTWRDKGFKAHSTRYLIWFAMGFSMTLAVHFYNTMIAGLFCVGIAVGYLGLLFRKAYFGRIMLAGILSIVVAVLPMGIAFATGTPLEGSLRWGMSIIEGSKDTGTQTQAPPAQQPGPSSQEEGVPGQESVSDEGLGEEDFGGDTPGTPSEAVEPPKPPFRERAAAWIGEKRFKVMNLATGLRDTVRTYVLNRLSEGEVVLCLFAVALLGILGVLYLFPKRTRNYGRTLISVAVFILFLFVMLMASWFGLPALMDQSRCSIYLAYGMALSLALAVDAVVSFLLGWIPRSFVMDGASLVGVAGLSAAIVLGGRYKEPRLLSALESNGAITCLTNILREEKPWMFTVCSANDELRMVEDYGYHYETITLLRAMEGSNVEGYLTIPTPRVYFFVEKIPIDYTEPYEGSGRTVSREGASLNLPGGAGLAMYKGDRRYIVMSRMYYWAETFRKLYPAEMKVYYESEEFICYVLEQNPYRLFDLSIDYGFNVR